MSKYSGKSHSSKKTSGFVRLFAAAAAMIFLIYMAVYGLGFEESGSARDIKLGLDLAGGVSITYQATEANPSQTDMDDTVYKLLLRAQSYSAEAEVYQEGLNRINVDIPDVTDANEILEDLGQPGSLIFQDPEGNDIFADIKGNAIQDATAGIADVDNDGNNEYLVYLTFTDEASKIFSEVTAANIGKVISIIYDGKTVSAPTVKSAITQGQCYIEGQSSYEEAEILAQTIRIGSLSLELEEIRSNVVGAKLGQDAIKTSLLAGEIGLVLVMLFMIVFYGLPGLASALALLIYVALTVVLLSGFQITLTLPGIAGIVLTIGMAVDANVIVFSRLREELAAGMSVAAARKAGYSKALSAILDGNITTLIAAVVLYIMGSGTVKGFATTLALGTCLSMFTALFVTRFIMTGLYEIGLQNENLYGKKAAMKQFPTIDFVGMKKKLFAVPCVLIAIGLAAMIVNGPVKGGDILNYSMEFKGGTSTTVTFNENYDLQAVNDQIIPYFTEVTGDNDVQVQTVSGSNQVIFKTRTLNTDERQALEASLTENFGITKDAIQEESISAVVSKEMKRDAIEAVVVAAILMLLYIWIRFRDIRIAGSTVIALLHDVFIVLTCYALFRWTVGNTFIACMLTVVGYSINDTIVIFDRMRENKKAATTKSELKDIINQSISQTLTRSLNTSVTTGIMVLVLLIFGVATIRDFAFPLLVGICAGFFSSVCLAGNLWHTFKKGNL